MCAERAFGRHVDKALPMADDWKSRKRPIFAARGCVTTEECARPRSRKRSAGNLRRPVIAAPCSVRSCRTCSEATSSPPTYAPSKPTATHSRHAAKPRTHTQPAATTKKRLVHDGLSLAHARDRHRKVFKALIEVVNTHRVWQVSHVYMKVRRLALVCRRGHSEGRR